MANHHPEPGKEASEPVDIEEEIDTLVGLVVHGKATARDRARYQELVAARSKRWTRPRPPIYSDTGAN